MADLILPPKYRSQQPAKPSLRDTLRVKDAEIAKLKADLHQQTTVANAFAHALGVKSGADAVPHLKAYAEAHDPTLKERAEKAAKARLGVEESAVPAVE